MHSGQGIGFGEDFIRAPTARADLLGKRDRHLQVRR